MARQQPYALAFVPEITAHLRAILERSRQQFREGKRLSEEEFWSQFEQAQPAKRSAAARRKNAVMQRGDK